MKGMRIEVGKEEGNPDRGKSLLYLIYGETPG